MVSVGVVVTDDCDELWLECGVILQFIGCEISGNGWWLLMVVILVVDVGCTGGSCGGLRWLFGDR